MDSILKKTTSQDFELKDVTVLEPTGKRAIGVVGDMLLVDSNGNEVTGFKVPASIQAYIGKPANGDFVTAYTSATTITVSSLPGGLTAIYDEDIELIRQINQDGIVVKTYGRGDATITVAGAVITVSGATFAATDTFVVYTNIPKASVAGGGGVGGGNNTYTNANNTDFVATITNGAATITITGLPFTLTEANVVLGTIKKKAVTTNLITTLSPTSVSVSGGVITLGGIANFVTGDEVYVTLIGPDKSYDNKINNQLVNVQNPEYSHTTSVETLVDETNVLGLKASGDAGGNTTTIVDADGAFTEASGGVAVGYTAYQTADAQNAKVSSVDSATNITTTTLSGAATWSSKAYSLPQVKRYEINMEGYNFMSLHYRLRALTFCNAYFKIYGTLDASATIDSDTGWVNLSAQLLGNSEGIAIPTSLTDIKEDIVIVDTPTTMLKYMVKLVVESSSASPNTNSFKVFVKKSS